MDIIEFGDKLKEFYRTDKDLTVALDAVKSIRRKHNNLLHEMRKYNDGFLYVAFSNQEYSGYVESIYCKVELLNSAKMLSVIDFDFIVTDNVNYKNNCIVHYASKSSIIENINNAEVSCDASRTEIISELHNCFGGIN